mgnify:CR=1 FL=1
MNAANHTFQLPPRSKARHNAGGYDQDSHTPRYAYEVLLPDHVKHLLEAKQFLMGPEGRRIWVWDFENKSDWPAFISIFKNGVLVEN